MFHEVADEVSASTAGSENRGSSILIQPKVWPHPKQTQEKYSFESLRKSIETILFTASNGNTQTTNQLMENLRYHVNQSLASISIFRSHFEKEREHVLCYCLSLAFYLEHILGWPGTDENISIYEQVSSIRKVFAKTQQTH